jgi:hypothetical protein
MLDKGLKFRILGHRIQIGWFTLDSGKRTFGFVYIGKPKIPKDMENEPRQHKDVCGND